MRKSYMIAATASIILSIHGCSNTSNQKGIGADQFPVSIDLAGEEAAMPQISTYGITEIRALDSTLIVSVMGNEGFWRVYSLPGLDSIGVYFNVGNGPYEFSMPIPCYQSSFYRTAGHRTLAFIPMPDRQKMMEADLTQLSEGGNLEESSRVLDVRSEQMPLWTYALDGDRYLQAVVDPEKPHIERSIKTFSNQSDTGLTSEYLDMLNSAGADSMEDLQLLLTSPAIGRNGRMVAEIPGYSNKIVIYDTQSGEGAYVEYKDMPAGKEELRELAKQNVSLFGGGYGYDDYFALIRNNIEYGKIAGQSIDFLSWEGEPLGTIETGMSTMRRFDIDRANGTLYCLDGAADAIKAYDIKAFLEKI